MKLQVVEFEDGSFGIRKTNMLSWLTNEYEYYHFENEYFSRASSSIYDWNKSGKVFTLEAYKALQVKGKKIDPDKVKRILTKTDLNDPGGIE